jgi:hypothetical protein
MIITKLYGGLGNQMFQYAAGISLADRLATKVIADTVWYADQEQLGVRATRQFELDIFGVKPNNYNVVDKLRLKIEPLKYFKEPPNKAMTFLQAIKNLNGNILLDGYWQSEKYFKNAEAKVFKTFSFSPSESSQALFNKITGSESISIHVRRGDYVNDPLTKKTYNNLAGSYYKQAIKIVTDVVRKPKFFVFSDDINWCKQNLKIDSVIYVEGNKSFEDMMLMSACKHNIIANSSFSWWGAWLNQNPGKIVVAPRRWFNDKTLDTKDLIPSAWQKI